MANINDSLDSLQSLDGFVGAALVDSERGVPLGVWGTGVEAAETSRGNSDLLELQRMTIKRLDLRDDIEDIVITLGRPYHLVRPLRKRPWLFFFLVLDREQANLAMARLQLADAENELVL